MGGGLVEGGVDVMKTKRGKTWGAVGMGECLWEFIFGLLDGADDCCWIWEKYLFMWDSLKVFGDILTHH